MFIYGDEVDCKVVWTSLSCRMYCIAHNLIKFGQILSKINYNYAVLLIERIRVSDLIKLNVAGR